ncbi:MAG: hypothetical protein ACI8TQ_000739 [Planctomycetota bacterium]|jgi:hypothetical protein
MRSANEIFIGFAIALALGSCGSKSKPTELSPSRSKVVFIGIDGATWDVMDPMLARGELPNIAKLIQRGSRAPLISLPPFSSPVVWTTMATGRFPRDHGILGFTYPFSASKNARPVSSDMRHVPAIWNIATKYGKRTGVIGYFVSHPPEQVDGFVVTDRFYQKIPGAVLPANLLDVITPQLMDGPSRQEILDRFLPWDYSPEAAKDPNAPHHKASLIVSGRVDDVVLRDEIYRKTSLGLMDQPVDLHMSYLRIVDHSSHSTWRYFDGSGFKEAAEPENIKLLGDIIPEAYRYVDDFIGEVVERCGEDTNLIIVSDHGFGPATEDYEVTEGKGMVLSGSHRADGILLAAGPDIINSSGDEIDMIDIMDVAPLLMTLTGLPISDELPGRIVSEILRPGYLEQFPIERVSSYVIEKSIVKGRAVPEEAERDMLDMLANLGYIDDGLEAGDEDIAEDLTIWDVSHSARMLAIAGELSHYVMRGSVEPARNLIELVRERDPRSAELLSKHVRATLRGVAASIDLKMDTFTNSETLESLGL